MVKYVSLNLLSLSFVYLLNMSWKRVGFWQRLKRCVDGGRDDGSVVDDVDDSRDDGNVVTTLSAVVMTEVLRIFAARDGGSKMMVSGVR